MIKKPAFLVLILIPAVLILYYLLERSKTTRLTGQADMEISETPKNTDETAGDRSGNPEADITTTWRFDFGDGKPVPGFQKVTPERKITSGESFGLIYGVSTGDTNGVLPETVEMAGQNRTDSDFIRSGEPFIFLADLPEGNYDAKISAGGIGGPSRLTLKAESRRLMIRSLEIPEGEVRTIEFTTNVRYPETGEGIKVRLKPREMGHFNWDRRISVEFGGLNPAIASVEITKNEGAVTVFLAGNSTVTDQRHEPWSAWGQMLPAFFKPGLVSVANHAESGEALKSFVAENRLEKLLSQVRPDDYVFIQFAHNDQKPQSSAYAAAFGDYQYYLRQYISEVRNLGAVPVLVTPMLRRNFSDEGKVINTHGDYPEAMRQVAREEKVILIDLFEMSSILYEALGPEGSKKLFVHYPEGTFPGQEEELKDNSHHSTYGAWQLAKCVIEGIRSSDMELALYLREGLPEYDPARPDPFNDWDLPLSLYLNPDTPEGR